MRAWQPHQPKPHPYLGSISRHFHIVGGGHDMRDEQPLARRETGHLYIYR